MIVMSDLMSWCRPIWRHPANRGMRVRALARAIGWQLYKRLTGRHLDIRVFSRLRLRCYPDSSWAGLMIYYRGRPEYHEMAFVSKYLTKGDVFLDVGANIGVYTLLAASVIGPDGGVVALEPGARAASILLENLVINKLAHVQLVQAAASNNDALVRFLGTEDATNRIVVHNGREFAVRVPAVRLDSICGDHRFALGKIDIEGAELMALEGATQLLTAHNPPVWQFEIKRHLLAEYSATPEQLCEYFQDFGFDLAYFDADSDALQFTSRVWELREDALAVARGYRDTVLQRLRSVTNGAE